VTKLSPSAQLLEHPLTHGWLAFGYIALLTGLFWLSDTAAYTKLYYALVAAPTLVVLLAQPKYLKIILHEPIVLAYLAFGAWLLLSLTWTSADTSPASLAKRPLYVFMMFAASALLAIKDEQLLLKALKIAAMLASLAALIGLAIFAKGTQGDRMIGTGALSNPLLSSHVYGFFCTYWIVIWLADRKSPPWLSIMFMAPLLAALLATGSRTPLAALALTGIWMLALAGQRALYCLAAIVTAVMVGLLLAPEALLARGMSYRPELWAEAIQQASRHAWIGLGYEADFSFLIPGIGHPLTDPHNVELAVLLQLGAIGLILWIVVYLVAFARCLTHRHHPGLQLASALVMYGLAAGLAEGSNFLSRPNENWFLIWIPLSLVAAISIALRQNASASTSLSNDQLAAVLHEADLIEEDGHGVKVAKLKDGTYMKLFRRKQLLSTALWAPPSRRFANNSAHLRSLGISAPIIKQLVHIPSAKLDGVIYQPLPGDTLRNRWRLMGDTERELEVRQFGRFLGTLHQAGIYFRSLHLGNVLKQPNGELALIDVSDMRFSQHPLKSWKRRRNLSHMLRYKEDSHWLVTLHSSALVSGYAEQCGETVGKRLGEILSTIQHGSL
jgi:O-antigen ligase/tRNA A-37 threonylcarbamoyl transferase component Bud32